MRRLPLLAAAILAACAHAPRPPEPAGRRLHVLFTGDGRGEVGPCACKASPTGGLARRAGALQDVRRDAAAVVVVDGGDALFQATSPRPAEGDEARARLVLEAMGRMGYVGLAVGERDLALGVDWLVREAGRAGVPLLGANLVRSDGTRPFAPARIVRTGAERVGIMAVAASAEYPGEVVAGEPIAAARAALAALRRDGATLVIALLHMPDRQARALIDAVPGVDVAIAAHDGRRLDPDPVGGTILAMSGERGRDLGFLLLWPDEPRVESWADAGAPRKAEVEVRAIARSVQGARARMERVRTSAEKLALKQFILAQEDRAEALAPRIARLPRGRHYDGWIRPLDPEVREEPQVRSAQERVLERWGPGAGE